MCQVRWVCSAEEMELGSEKATGSCPYCGGTVIAADVETSWWLCCLPLSRTIKRNYSCSRCSRRLVISSSLY